MYKCVRTSLNGSVPFFLSCNQIKSAKTRYFHLQDTTQTFESVLRYLYPLLNIIFYFSNLKQAVLSTHIHYTYSQFKCNHL